MERQTQFRSAMYNAYICKTYRYVKRFFFFLFEQFSMCSKIWYKHHADDVKFVETKKRAEIPKMYERKIK